MYDERKITQPQHKIHLRLVKTSGLQSQKEILKAQSTEDIFSGGTITNALRELAVNKAV